MEGAALEGKPVDVWKYDRPSTIASPAHLRLSFLAADPPTQSAVYPAEVAHRVECCVERLQVATSHHNLSPLAYEQRLGMMLNLFPSRLAKLRPSVLMMCMHFEHDKKREAGQAAQGKVLHFAEKDGSGVATANAMAAMLAKHQRCMDRVDSLACVVFMACDCEALGGVVSSAMGANVRVLVTTRILYQSQAEAWAPGFVDALACGASVVDAMACARRAVNQECPESSIDAKGRRVSLRIEPNDPLFVCYCDGERIDRNDDVFILRATVDGMHDAGWTRVRALLSAPFPADAPTALGRGLKQRGLSDAYVPMTVHASNIAPPGTKKDADTKSQQQQQGEAPAERCLLGDVWRLAVERGGDGCKRIVVEGVAGMGKSTIAHMLGSHQGVKGWPEHMRAVVVVNLSTLKRDMGTLRRPSLKKVLCKAFRLRRSAAEEPVDWLTLHRKEVVWVFDSYDEVELRAGEGSTAFDRWLDGIVRGTEWTDVIEYLMVMTRPGRGRETFPNALHVSLDVWSEASIRDYVHRFGSSLGQTPGAPPLDAGRAAQPPVSTFEQHALEILLDNSALPGDFAGIPFVCEIACHLVAEERVSPAQRVDLCVLYGAMVELMWDHEGLMTRPNGTDVRRVLSACALYFLKHDGVLPSSPEDLEVDTALSEVLQATARAQLKDLGRPATKDGLDAQVVIVLRKAFEAASGSWAVRRGGFAHKTIMEYLVANALVTQSEAGFGRDLGAQVQLDAATDRMVLVFLAGLLRSRSQSTEDKAAAARAAKMQTMLVKHVAQLMVTKYKASRDKYTMEELQASYEARDELRRACGASLAMEVLTVLQANEEDTAAVTAFRQLRGHTKAVVRASSRLAFGGSPLERLHRILLEPAARFGNLELVSFLVMKRFGGAVEAVRAAASAGQGPVVEWCMRCDTAAADAFRVEDVAAAGNHRLLRRLLQGKVNGVVVDPKHVGPAVKRAAQCGQLEAMRVLIGVGGADPLDALKAALAPNVDASVLRECIAEYAPVLVSSQVAKVSQRRKRWDVLRSVISVKSDVTIGGVKMGAEACAQVAQALSDVPCSITRITLTACSIRNRGATELAQVLARNRSLQRLDLSNNKLGPPGCVALGAALRTNSTLRELALGGNNVGGECVSALAVAGHQRLLQWLLDGRVEGVKAQRGAEPLRAAVRQAAGLGEEEVMCMLIEVGEASALDAFETALGKDQVAAAKTCMQKYLTVGEPGEEGGGRSLLSIRNATMAAVVHKQWWVIPQAMTRCAAALTSLDISGCTLKREACAAVAAGLCAVTGVTHVTMDRCRISDRGVTELAQAVAGNTSITHLSLCGNKIGSAGLVALGAALQPGGNSTLTHLTLGGNALDAGGAAAALAVAGHSRLLCWLLRGQVGGLEAPVEGSTALQHAVRQAARTGHVQSMRVLVEVGKAVPTDALEGALEGGQRVAAKECIEAFDALPTDVDTVLVMAHRNRAWWLLEWLSRAQRDHLVACMTNTAAPLEPHLVVGCATVDGVPLVQQAAMEAVLSMCAEPAGRRAVRSAGGIETCVACMSRPEARSAACRALACFAVEEGHGDDMLEAGAVHALAAFCNQVMQRPRDDTLALVAAVEGLATLAEHSAAVCDVLCSQVLPCFVRCMAMAHEKRLQRAVAQAMANIALHEAHCATLATSGALACVVQHGLERTQVAPVKREAARCVLGASAWVANCEVVAAHDGVSGLVACLGSDQEDDVRMWASRALSGLAPNAADVIRTAGGIAALIHCVRATAASTSVRLWASGALGNLAINDPNRVAIGQQGGLKALLALLAQLLEHQQQQQQQEQQGQQEQQEQEEEQQPQHNDEDAPLSPSPSHGNECNASLLLGALCNLVVGTNANRDGVREAGGVPLLIQCMQAYAPADAGSGNSVLSAAVKAVSNVVHGSERNAKAVVEAGGVPALVGVLRRAACGDEARQRVARAMRKLVETVSSIRRDLITGGAMEALAGCLGADGGVSQVVKRQAELTFVQLAQRGDEGPVEPGSASCVQEQWLIPLLIQCLVSRSKEVKLGAAHALYDAAADARNKDIIQKAGGLPPLVACLGSRSNHVQRWAAAALKRLCTDCDTNSDVIRAAKGLPPLVHLLQSPCEAVCTEAAGALAELARGNAINQDVILGVGAVPLLLSLVEREALGVGAKRRSLEALAALVHRSQEGRDAVCHANGILIVVACLGRDSDAVTRAAGRTLAHIASGSESNRDAIVFAGAADALVRCLGSTSLEVRRSVAHALGALAASAAIGDTIRDAGAIPDLVHCLAAQDDPLSEHVARTLGNLVANNAVNRDAVREAGGLVPLVTCLGRPLEGLRCAAARACVLLAKENAVNGNIIHDAGAIPLLLTAMSSTSSEVKCQAAQALCQLARGNFVIQGVIHEAKGVDTLARCLNELHSTDESRYWAARALASVLKTEEHRVMAGAAGLHRPLVACLHSDSERVQRGAACALADLVDGSERNGLAVREAGAVEPLVACLRCRGNAALRNEAARALANAALVDAKCRDVIREAQGVQVLMSMLQETDVRCMAVRALSELIRCNQANGNFVRQSNGIAQLVECVSASNDLDELRYWAAFALGHLANLEGMSGPIRAADGIPALVGALITGSGQTQLSSAWALSQLALVKLNVASIRSAGAMAPLVRGLHSDVAGVRMWAAVALGELTHDGTEAALLRSCILGLVECLNHRTEGVRSRASEALRKLSYSSANSRKIMTEMGHDARR